MLYGIDCLNQACVHDTIRGFRLRFRVRRDPKCMLCRREGVALPSHTTPAGEVVDGRRRCSACNTDWRTAFVKERNDMIFRPTELEAALSQMRVLGCKDQVEPDTAHLVEEHISLPPAHDARLLYLTREPLPKVAVYFRWYPLAGQTLTPDLVFQCEFGPTMSAVERRGAPERRLTEEQFYELTQVNYGGDPWGSGFEVSRSHTVSYSNVRCQHCGERLPVRTFNTLTLRAVTKGD